MFEIENNRTTGLGGAVIKYSIDDGVWCTASIQIYT